MDGLHDLGGKEGYGPIAVSDKDPAFPETWEARVYALSQNAESPNWTIDWFRHLVELLPPKAYMNEPYFQKWLMVLVTGMVQDGTITRDEALGGPPQSRADPPPAASLKDVLTAVRHEDHSFALDPGTAPVFAVGQTVQTRTHSTPLHCRLPAYARGRTGRVIAHHGGHVFPDTSATGVHEGQHLYTVAFTAPELWGADANPRDTVTLDLWESYLVQT